MSEAASHFQTGGADYAAFRPTYPPELARALAGLAPDGEAAIDVGCGSGQLAVALAGHFRRVTGVDVSADQIAAAGRPGNVDYLIGAAEALPLPDRSASLIVAAQAAHWFDLPRFYAEIRRVAAPGAALALISYGVMRVEGAFAERFGRFYWKEIHP
ncbi:MAG: class I SAM-dependent methyltransferase [Paracoccus sp. (in: a-proteobacteria)]